MPYDLSIEERPSYLHAKAMGAHTADNVCALLAAVYYACVQRNRRALVLELNLSGASLPIVKIFDVISEGSGRGQMLERIAYVDTSAERDPAHMRFAETVAVNRGVNVRLFRTLEEGERGLCSGEASPADRSR